MQRNANLGPIRIVILIIALLLIGLAWWQVLSVPRGLTVRHLTQDGVPLRFLARAGATDAPGVLVAHGFSGSQQLMLGYGYTLAKAGYGVVLWDFSGHGANANLRGGSDGMLQEDVNAAYAALVGQPEIDPERVAILGHSMGSSAAMRAGVMQPQRYRAVVAISPSRADVSPTLPHNFLLQAGSLERPFAERAALLLAQAGGPNRDFAAGLARDFLLVPHVEHISILFHPRSHHAARAWLAQTFGVQAASDYTDRRIIWYGLHLAGWLLLGTAVSPSIAKPEPVDRRRTPWHWLALILAPFLATSALTLLGQVVSLRGVGGLLVGGALALWFLIMGLIWLAAGWRVQMGNGRVLLQGLLAFTFLWLAFGALAQLVWLPWLLIPARLLRWPFLAAALLPWGLAAGYAQQGAGWGRRIRWWLAQSLLFMAALAVVVLLVPDLFFLSLILPVLPIVLGIMGIANAIADEAWATAVSNALFFAWLLLAVFPLAG